MEQPIYKVFLVKPTESFYALSPEDRNKLTAFNAEAHEKVGAKVTIACDSSWCSEEWPFWGVEEFPDLEAVKKFTNLLNEQNWYQYFNSISVLGNAVS